LGIKEIEMKKNATKRMRNHPMYSAADYAYLREKGYGDDEILGIWNRDHALGKEPKTHTEKAFDLVGYLNR
jgi:hypothetical protein